MTSGDDPARWLNGPENLDGVEVTAGPEGIAWSQIIIKPDGASFPPTGAKWLGGLALVAGHLVGQDDELIPVCLIVLSVADTPGGVETRVWPVLTDPAGLAAFRDSINGLLESFDELRGEGHGYAD